MNLCVLYRSWDQRDNSISIQICLYALLYIWKVPNMSALICTVSCEMRTARERISRKHTLLFLLVFGPLIDQILEQTVRSVQKSLRSIEFDGLAIAHHQNVVTIHDSVQAMGNGETSGVLEIVPEDTLNPSVCFSVDGGCGCQKK